MERAASPDNLVVVFNGSTTAFQAVSTGSNPVNQSEKESMVKPSGSPNLAMLTGVSEFVSAGMGQQNSNLGLNDHVMFDFVWDFRGGLFLSLDTLSSYTTTLGANSVGRFKLRKGPSYLLQASLGFVQQNAPTAQHVFCWFDATIGGNFGTPIQVQPYTLGSDFSDCSVLSAVYTPTRDNTLVEVRLIESVSGSVSQIGLSARAESWAFVQTI